MIDKSLYLNIIEFFNEKSVRLVAVSKTKPPAAIESLYDLGQRVFGENKVQELCDKQASLAKDIEWHMIGHLQRNKVKYIAPFIAMIHSVDSLKLLQEINKQAKKESRKINCLLQVHIAEETHKFGFAREELNDMLKSDVYAQMENVEICGLMGMATFTNNQNQLKQEFTKLKEIFEALKSDYFSAQESFKELSMGMSGDYELAIDCGSTMVRIGSLIFGSR